MTETLFNRQLILITTMASKWTWFPPLQMTNCRHWISRKNHNNYFPPHSPCVFEVHYNYRPYPETSPDEMHPSKLSLARSSNTEKCETNLSPCHFISFAHSLLFFFFQLLHSIIFIAAKLIRFPKASLLPQPTTILLPLKFFPLLLICSASYVHTPLHFAESFQRRTLAHSFRR